LIAVARDREVGVDVEEVCLEDVEPIVRTVFSPVERAALARLSGPARLEAFYRGWTRKEAFVKALGVGLHADLTAFDVSVDAAQPRLLAMRPPLPRDRHWTLADITLDAQHRAAMAVEGTAAAKCRLLDWHGTTRTNDFSSQTSERAQAVAAPRE
jgi:4'-phosphopantetheinyl transferase